LFLIKKKHQKKFSLAKGGAFFSSKGRFFDLFPRAPRPLVTPLESTIEFLNDNASKLRKHYIHLNRKNFINKTVSCITKVSSHNIITHFYLNFFIFYIIFYFLIIYYDNDDDESRNLHIFKMCGTKTF
jgi:hypothetical protein